MSKRLKMKKNKDFSERHFGVILEDVDSKLDLVVEGQQGLAKRIDGLDKKVDGLDKKVDGLDKKVDGLDKKVDGLDKKVDGLDKKVDGNHREFQEFRKEVNYKFEIVFDELRLIRNELKEKVGRDEFALLEKRVMALEKSRR